MFTDYKCCWMSNIQLIAKYVRNQVFGNVPDLGLDWNLSHRGQRVILVLNSFHVVTRVNVSNQGKDEKTHNQI